MTKIQEQLEESNRLLRSNSIPEAGASVKCYLCTSLLPSQSWCADADELAAQGDSATTTCNTGSCAYTSGESEGTEVHNRGCAAAAGYPDDCLKVTADHADLKLSQCFCSTDLCNSAPRLGPSAIFGVIISILFFVKFY